MRYIAILLLIAFIVSGCTQENNSDENARIPDTERIEQSSVDNAGHVLSKQEWILLFESLGIDLVEAEDLNVEYYKYRFDIINNHALVSYYNNGENAYGYFNSEGKLVTTFNWSDSPKAYRVQEHIYFIIETESGVGVRDIFSSWWIKPKYTGIYIENNYIILHSFLGTNGDIVLTEEQKKWNEWNIGISPNEVWETEYLDFNLNPIIKAVEGNGGCFLNGYAVVQLNGDEKLSYINRVTGDILKSVTYPKKDQNYSFGVINAAWNPYIIAIYDEPGLAFAPIRLIDFSGENTTVVDACGELTELEKRFCKKWNDVYSKAKNEYLSITLNEDRTASFGGDNGQFYWAFIGIRDQYNVLIAVQDKAGNYSDVFLIETHDISPVSIMFN